MLSAHALLLRHHHPTHEPCPPPCVHQGTCSASQAPGLPGCLQESHRLPVRTATRLPAVEAAQAGCVANLHVRICTRSGLPASLAQTDHPKNNSSTQPTGDVPVPKSSCKGIQLLGRPLPSTFFSPLPLFLSPLTLHTSHLACMCWCGRATAQPALAPPPGAALAAAQPGRVGSPWRPAPALLAVAAAAAAAVEEKWEGILASGIWLWLPQHLPPAAWLGPRWRAGLGPAVQDWAAP